MQLDRIFSRRRKIRELEDRLTDEIGTMQVSPISPEIEALLAKYRIPALNATPSWAGNAAKMLSLPGVRITAFRLTEQQLSELERSTGQKQIMFGKPVLPRERATPCKHY